MKTDEKYTKSSTSDTFTRKYFTLHPFRTQTLLHTDPFTNKLSYIFFTHRHFYPQTLFHKSLLRKYRFNTDAFSHGLLYTHRRFYTQTLSHTNTFTHRRFYTQTHLKRERETEKREREREREREDEDVKKMWRCEDVCESEKMWRCEDVKVKGERERERRCEYVNMWGCEDVNMWRCIADLRS